MTYVGLPLFTNSNGGMSGDSSLRAHETKAAPSEEFETTCLLWRMEFAFHTFKAVRAGIERSLERKLHSDEPEYYPMLVGLIWLYARAFTNNRPVGPLPDDIVPQEYRHSKILASFASMFSMPTYQSFRS